MKISKLVKLLSDIQETRGDLDVRAGSSLDPVQPPLVTGLWVDSTTSQPYVKLAIPDKRRGW